MENRERLEYALNAKGAGRRSGPIPREFSTRC